MVSCGSKGDNDFVSRWENSVKSAIDSCHIRNVKGYFLQHLGFIRSKGIRTKIVQGITTDWGELKVIESFGDDPHDYFASIVLDDSTLYEAHFEKGPESFRMIKIPKGSDEYEREIQLFEDFPPYKIKCDSSADVTFYFRGKKD
jgi:hypothetical protein